jgi:acylphosphatase
MEQQASVTVKITGLVQGVGFRFFAEKWAKRLKLAGYAMNRWDGSVFVEAEGRREDLLAFLDQLKKGPVGAVVEGLEVTWGPYQGRFTDFSIRFEGWS